MKSEQWTGWKVKNKGKKKKKEKKKETQKCKRKNYKLYPNPHYMSTTWLCWFDSIEGADAGMAIEKTQFRLVSMFLISVMDDLYILYERKHYVDNDTSLGLAKDPLILKLA